MVWEFVAGFLLLVVASYVGTTMALRGFFGRKYADPRTGEFDAGRDDRSDDEASAADRD